MILLESERENSIFSSIFFLEEIKATLDLELVDSTKSAGGPPTHQNSDMDIQKKIVKRGKTISHFIDFRRNCNIKNELVK